MPILPAARAPSSVRCGQSIGRVLEQGAVHVDETGWRTSGEGRALSFLALEVIPHLKLTDRGLVDVDSMRIVPLFESIAEA